MSTDTDPQFTDQSRVTGYGNPDNHRAGAGEGVRAPFASDGADHSEFSIFDGAGNEQVVVVTNNKDGKPVQSTGDSSASAMKGVNKLKGRLGAAFGHATGH